MAAASRASPQHARPGSTFSNPRNAAPPGSPGGDQDAGSKRRYGHGGALLTMPKRALFRRSSRQPQPSTRMTARVAGRTATSHWRSAGPHHHHGARSHRCRWPGARARAGAACETGQAARAAGPSCHANPAACRIRPSARWPARRRAGAPMAPLAPEAKAGTWYHGAGGPGGRCRAGGLLSGSGRGAAVRSQGRGKERA